MSLILSHLISQTALISRADGRERGRSDDFTAATKLATEQTLLARREIDDDRDASDHNLSNEVIKYLSL